MKKHLIKWLPKLAIWAFVIGSAFALGVNHKAMFEWSGKALLDLSNATYYMESEVMCEQG